MERVEDGATIQVKLGNEALSVRYAGILGPDDPKSHAGEAAKKANARLVERKTVELEADITDVDDFKHAVRWVWLDGELANVRLVRDGHARPHPETPDVRYRDRLLQAESESKTEALRMFLRNTFGQAGVEWYRSLDLDRPFTRGRAGAWKLNDRVFLEGDMGDTVHVDSGASSTDDLRATCEAVAQFVFAPENAGLGLKRIKVHNYLHRQSVKRSGPTAPCK